MELTGAALLASAPGALTCPVCRPGLSLGPSHTNTWRGGTGNKAELNEITKKSSVLISTVNVDFSLPKSHTIRFWRHLWFTACALGSHSSAGGFGNESEALRIQTRPLTLIL